MQSHSKQIITAENWDVKPHILGNAVEVGVEEGGEGAFATARGANKDEDALLRGGKAGSGV